MRVVIHRDKCIGGGSCVLTAPAVFTQSDDDGMVILLDANPPENLHAAVRQAVELCPAKVISIE
jgi:ferredoxin